MAADLTTEYVTLRELCRRGGVHHSACGAMRAILLTLRLPHARQGRTYLISEEVADRVLAEYRDQASRTDSARFA